MKLAELLPRTILTFIEEELFMIKEIAHVGITVSDMKKSIEFYRDVLGLTYVGSITMEGAATDLLFNREHCVADVAYLNGSDQLLAPPIELIQFVSGNVSREPSSLHKTSISEICFRVEDMDAVYQELKSKNVEFLSPPQFFDFSQQGFGKSKAVYLKDPDGIILEFMQYLD